MWQKTNTYSFFNKVVNRLDQLRAAKVSGMSGKSIMI